MTMIGPHFGLDRDYDTFVVGMAPRLWALLVALFKTPDAAAWVGDQLRSVLDVDTLTHAGMAPTGAWTLHVAHAFELKTLWNETAQRLNVRGGLPAWALEAPPIWAPEPDDAPEWARFEGELAEGAQAITPAAFQKVARTLRARPPSRSPVELALELLVLDVPTDGAVADLLAHLHQVGTKT
jgi:hypothetical protein